MMVIRCYGNSLVSVDCCGNGGVVAEQVWAKSLRGLQEGYKDTRKRGDGDDVAVLTEASHGVGGQVRSESKRRGRE